MLPKSQPKPEFSLEALYPGSELVGSYSQQNGTKIGLLNIMNSHGNEAILVKLPRNYDTASIDPVSTSSQSPAANYSSFIEDIADIKSIEEIYEQKKTEASRALGIITAKVSTWSTYYEKNQDFDSEQNPEIHLTNNEKLVWADELFKRFNLTNTEVRHLVRLREECKVSRYDGSYDSSFKPEYLELAQEYLGYYQPVIDYGLQNLDLLDKAKLQPSVMFSYYKLCKNVLDANKKLKDDKVEGHELQKAKFKISQNFDYEFNSRITPFIRNKKFSNGKDKFDDAKKEGLIKMQIQLLPEFTGDFMEVA